MSPEIFLAGVGSLFAVVAANVAVISWIRTDMKSFETEIRGWNSEINKEMKDFHGRLCAVEEKNKEKKSQYDGRF